MAVALRSEVVNAPEKSSRALAHVLWSVASWARRKPVQGGVQVQVTRSYVEVGAEVARRPAEWALAAFRRWTGGEARAGWITLTSAALAAAWEALEWVKGRGLLSPPAVVPSVLEPAFPVVLPGKGKGKTRCGCPAHAHGDRDPSLLFDLHRGLATCAVSGEVFALVEGVEGFVAHRIHRGVASEEPAFSLTIHKDTPPVGPDLDHPVERVGEAGEDAGGGAHGGECRSEAEYRQAEAAGRPGPDPRCEGTATGRLWSSGLSLSLSRATSREGWAAWQEKRWGGASGEALAWEEMAHRERPTGVPRGWMPERFVGVGWWRPTSIFWMEGASGRRWPILDLEEMGTGHVLLDIDGCDPLTYEAPGGMVAAIRKELEHRGIFGEVSWVLRTSRRGLQIMVKLQRFRWDVAGFYHSPAVRAVLQEAGERIARLVGGKVDPSSWAPKRMARAPGWRVKADPEAAHLWYLREG
jgi:hypothetical protein